MLLLESARDERVGSRVEISIHAGKTVELSIELEPISHRDHRRRSSHKNEHLRDKLDHLRALGPFFGSHYFPAGIAR
jgi:hypothetical protein